MTKIARKHLAQDELGQYINNLWSAFTLMESKEDIRLLFKDMFTPTEFRMFAKRLEIAIRLLEQQKYEDIQRQLNVTAGTISKINNTLMEGGQGYRKAWQRLNAIKVRRNGELALPAKRQSASRTLTV